MKPAPGTANGRRAVRGLRALRAHQAPPPRKRTDVTREAFIDAVTDLFHTCLELGIDHAMVASRALYHIRAERGFIR